MDKYRKERVEVTKRMIKAMKMMKLQKKKNYFIASVLNVSPATVSRYTNKKRVDMTLKKRSGRTTGSSTGLNDGIAEFKDWTPENSMVGSVGLFIKGWSKVAFWIGAAVFIWVVLSLK